MIIIYVLTHCPYCNNALKLLEDNNIKYKKIIVENTEESKKHYKKQSGMNTFPQIFLKINKDNILKIGGYSDLIAIIDKSKNIKSSNISIESIYYMYNLLYKK